MGNCVFGALRKDEGFGWWGKQMLSLGGNTYNVDVIIQGDEISGRQKEAFARFVEKWPIFQTELIEALIKYYNEKERFAYGPEDAEEKKKWWPEIETEEALLQMVSLETIVVAEDFMMDDGRHVYLLFSRTWGGDDLDDNGIGICCINETIDEIGHKDIAF